MKKIVCILTAFICCIGVAASAESHIGIQGSIADRTDSNIVYIDLYEEDNTISIISDLIPDIIIQSANDHADLYDMFISLRKKPSVYGTRRKIFTGTGSNHDIQKQMKAYIQDLYLRRQHQSV